MCAPLDIQVPVHVQPVLMGTIKTDFRLASTLPNKAEEPELCKAVSDQYIKDKYKHYTKIYTDGSKNPEEKIAGAGFVVYDDKDVEIHNCAAKLDHRVSVYTTELLAMLGALNWLTQNQLISQVVIITCL